MAEEAAAGRRFGRAAAAAAVTTPRWLRLAPLLMLMPCAMASMTPARRSAPRTRGLYDGGVTQFSPDGALQQVEYAKRAVERAEPALAAIVDSVVDPTGSAAGGNGDGGGAGGGRRPSGGGIVVAARVAGRGPRRLRVAGSAAAREKLHRVDDHVVCAVAGLAPDALALVKLAREAARDHRRSWGEPIAVDMLARLVSNEVQACTQYGGNRPYGASLLLAGFDHGSGRFRIAETDPSGNYRLLEGDPADNAPGLHRDGGDFGTAATAGDGTGGSQQRGEEAKEEEEEEEGGEEESPPPRRSWLQRTAGVGKGSDKLRRRFGQLMSSRMAAITTDSTDDDDDDGDSTREAAEGAAPSSAPSALPDASAALGRVLMGKRGAWETHDAVKGTEEDGDESDDADDDADDDDDDDDDDDSRQGEEEDEEDDRMTEFATIVLRPRKTSSSGSSVQWVPAIFFSSEPLRQADIDRAANEPVDTYIEMLP